MGNDGLTQDGLVDYLASLANQEKICPLENLVSVYVDFDGVQSNTDFEIIEIVDGANPCPTLVGTDWIFDNLGIIKSNDPTQEVK